MDRLKFERLIAFLVNMQANGGLKGNKAPNYIVEKFERFDGGGSQALDGTRAKELDDYLAKWDGHLPESAPEQPAKADAAKAVIEAMEGLTTISSGTDRDGSWERVEREGLRKLEEAVDALREAGG